VQLSISIKLEKEYHSHWPSYFVTYLPAEDYLEWR